MFDLKPNAPAEIRGPFRPMGANVPGVRICEHLPRIAGMADRFALVRSVSHDNSNHTPMIYYTLTAVRFAVGLRVERFFVEQFFRVRRAGWSAPLRPPSSRRPFLAVVAGG
jgi:hypothetical protein